MKNLILSLLVLVALSQTSFSQSYESSIGIRLGYPFSLSYKKFISQDALEATLGFRSYDYTSAVNASLSYQIHRDLDKVDNLTYYYGAGAAVYLWKYRYYSTYFEEYYRDSQIGVSILGHIGLDYKFEGIPLNLSLDAIPIIHISGYGPSYGIGFGLAARYVLN